MLKRGSKSLEILIAAGTIALVVGLFPVAQAQQPPLSVQGDVTIVADNCGLVLNSGGQLSFGNLANNQISTEQVTKFTNNGNIRGDIAVKGTNWVDGADPDILVMSVGATRFQLTSGDYNVKAPLMDQNTLTGLGGNPGVQESLYWQLKATLTNAAYQGNAKQVITISSLC